MLAGKNEWGEGRMNKARFFCNVHEVGSSESEFQEHQIRSSIGVREATSRRLSVNSMLTAYFFS